MGKGNVLLIPILLSFMFLASCVEVRTYVKANGYVVKEIIIRTNRYYEDSLRDRAKGALEGWSVWRTRKGDVVEIHMRRKFAPEQLGSPLPGMKVKYERKLSWFPPTGHYRYSETFDFTKFAKAISLLEPELGALSKVTMTVLIVMPSKVLLQGSNSKDIQGNVARWVIDDFGEQLGRQPIEFEVAASGMRKLLLTFYMLIVLIVLIGSYIFYPRAAFWMKEIADRLRTGVFFMRVRRQRRTGE